MNDPLETDDEIIEELWEIKDSMAREHGNDVRKLAAYLRGRRSSGSMESSAGDTQDEALRRPRLPNSP